ncbi:MAG: MBOAT family protein [Desulfobacula sp.]|nr:MBOAT family protein [Desulfobacula sp.]
MLFSSYEFIFVFLPVVCFVFFILASYNYKNAIGFLVFSSLFYYGWWNPIYLILILSSMIINYRIGSILQKKNGNQKKYLIIGITLNLILLAYFKYAIFIVENINIIFNFGFSIGKIILPLGISFFTFQQITYLVDTYNKHTKKYGFLEYALFVTFFPQLIAGPIVHHREMLPQFEDKRTFKPKLENLNVGLSIFVIGLFKKVFIADGIAQYSSPIFDTVSAGQTVTFFEAWGGAIGYTFQLYFDFSGYSDMAIGVARIFGIKLPINFFSPYKALSIIDFWRRWHITLSRFLKAYLYIPLGGNKKGTVNRYRNLLITMMLGGLWHGAGWTFVVWGALHGVYLIINHGWNKLKQSISLKINQFQFVGKGFSWLITFFAVVIGWVIFRSADLNSAILFLKSMFGFYGISVPNGVAVRLGPVWEILKYCGVGTYIGGGLHFILMYSWVITTTIIVLMSPNTYQLFSKFDPALMPYAFNKKTNSFPKIKAINKWEPNNFWAIVSGVLAAICVLSLARVSEFLYFQF